MWTVAGSPRRIETVVMHFLRSVAEVTLKIKRQLKALDWNYRLIILQLEFHTTGTNGVRRLYSTQSFELWSTARKEWRKTND